jgi:pimeloyl-ACP methyl ester carboxylesterase
MNDASLLEVHSHDGTILGVERLGDGPPLLAVHGSTADRSRWAAVRDALSRQFMLYLLDRRGRGTSTRETLAPYSLRREAEDVMAVIDAIGEPVRYLGHSYGALIGIEVLPLTDQIASALLYEPPFDVDGQEVCPASFRHRFAEMLAAGQREEALELFFRDVISVDPTPLKRLPIWQARLAAAHTLEREGDAVATYVPNQTQLATVRVPVTMLLGLASPQPLQMATRLAAASIPDAHLIEVPDQGHAMIEWEGFVPIVVKALE